MNSYRKTAIIVGILYIIGTVAGVLSVVITTPILSASDYLAQVAANPNQLTTGALLVLLMGLVLAMVPVMLFPIFRKINEILAVGYVVFRGGLETVTSIVSVIPWLFLLIVAREYAAAGAPDASYFQTLGSLLKEGIDSLAPIRGIVFSLGALMIYYILYQSKLIPRWISGWGVLAILLHLASSFLILFHLQTAFSTEQHDHEFSDIFSGNGYGGMADRQRLQLICSRIAVCENSDEPALERRVDLHSKEKENEYHRKDRKVCRASHISPTS